MARAYEVVVHAGPLPALTDEAPSKTELAFRGLLERPAEFARWAREVRADWMRRRGLQPRRAEA